MCIRDSPLGHVQVGELVQVLLSDPPADEIGCHKLGLEGLVVKKFLHEPQSQVRALGVARQNKGPALVVVLQIPRECLPHILVSGAQVGATDVYKRQGLHRAVQSECQ